MNQKYTYFGPDGMSSGIEYDGPAEYAAGCAPAGHVAILGPAADHERSQLATVDDGFGNVTYRACPAPRPRKPADTAKVTHVWDGEAWVQTLTWSGQVADLRARRNAALAASDARARIELDALLSPELRRYRQALRDLPAQAADGRIPDLPVLEGPT